jgi:ribosomal protein S10
MPVTVISGPHVHKKSRTQYKMDWYRGLFVIDLRRREHPRVGTANSVTYKKELLDTLHLDEGFQVSFSYASTGIITLD